MADAYTKLAEIPAWALEEYAEGKEMPEVAAFFKQNAAAYEQWLQDEQLFSDIQKRLSRFSCPSPEKMQDFHWNDLPPSERLAIEKHLQVCPTCAEEQAMFRKFSVATIQPAQKPLTQPLPSLQERFDAALNRFQAKLADVRMAVAILVNPPGAQLAMSNLRGADDEQENKNAPRSPQIYEFEDTTIILTIRSADMQRKNLYGQILTPLPTEQSILHLIPANPAHKDLTTHLDDVGNFEFLDIAEDDYQLLCIQDEQTILIPVLSLQ